MKFLFLIFSLMFIGCTAIDARRLEKDVKNIADTVETICTTAEVFSAFGKEVPVVDQCRNALRTADVIRDYGDTIAIAETIECIENHDVKSVGFVQCVGSQKWVPILLDRIILEIKKTKL